MLIGEPSLGLFGDVCGMIVEDQFDCCVGWIGGVEQLEKFDEFAAAMTVPDESVNLYNGESCNVEDDVRSQIAEFLVPDFKAVS
jgi:hypothetical protein